jgi:phosphomannomutase/phosphoglucomutase
VRGTVPDALNADVVYTIARAYATQAQSKNITQVVIARDGRNSGPELLQALAEGLQAGGLDVLNIGMVPTPVLYFACHHLKTGSGIMLTGSHNPSNYNGLKMMLAGETLSGDAVQALYHITQLGEFVAGQGSLQEMDVKAAYLEAITQQINLQKPIKLAIDCGNGVTGELAPKLLQALGCEVTTLYTDIDGDFPNHHPDPSKPENLQDLINTVQNNKLDLGLAFDGDGDRLGVVTNTGEIIYPDRQMILFARDVLAKRQGAPIIYDVKCSRLLRQAITDARGTPIMARTGHSFVKAELKAQNAPLAGEMSGHIFFNDDWYGFDDALYAAARLLRILCNSEQTPSEILSNLPDAINTPEINISVTDEEKFAIVARFAELATFPDGEVDTTDGVRVDFHDGFGLIRASNTTPNLVLRFEGDDEASLVRIQEAFEEQLAALDLRL